MTGVVVWLSGLPASGKSTLARRIAAALSEQERPVAVLDGDEMRAVLVPHAGHDEAARDAFYGILGRLAGALARQGLCVLVPATSHRRRWREQARAEAPRYLEILVDVPLAICAERDPKGLYAAARRGEAPHLPGVGTTFEPPPKPDVVAHGGNDDDALRDVLARLGT
jgi:adenylylsulfate kinase